jgi:hypothetical protein
MDFETYITVFQSFRDLKVAFEIALAKKCFYQCQTFFQIEKQKSRKPDKRFESIRSLLEFVSRTVGEWTERQEGKRQKDRKTKGQMNRRTERQKDRRTEGQKDRKTERQKDRKTEGQKDRETE